MVCPGGRGRGCGKAKRLRSRLSRNLADRGGNDRYARLARRALRSRKRASLRGPPSGWRTGFSESRARLAEDRRWLRRWWIAEAGRAGCYWRHSPPITVSTPPVEPQRRRQSLNWCRLHQLKPDRTRPREAAIPSASCSNSIERWKVIQRCSGPLAWRVPGTNSGKACLIITTF